MTVATSVETVVTMLVIAGAMAAEAENGKWISMIDRQFPCNFVQSVRTFIRSFRPSSQDGSGEQCSIDYFWSIENNSSDISYLMVSFQSSKLSQTKWMNQTKPK